MDEKITVGMGEAASGSGSGVFVARTLGSCVAVCLYDKQRQNGVMVHVVLPDERCGLNTDNPFIYASAGVRRAIEIMEDMGTPTWDIRAYVIGGANVLTCIKNGRDIGKKNYERAKKELFKKGIKPTGQYTGGRVSRTVEFDIETGGLHITEISA